MFLNVIVDFESSDLCCKVTFLVWNEAAAKLARYLSNSTPTARPSPPTIHLFNATVIVSSLTFV